MEALLLLTGRTVALERLEGPELSLLTAARGAPRGS